MLGESIDVTKNIGQMVHGSQGLLKLLKLFGLSPTIVLQYLSWKEENLWIILMNDARNSITLFPVRAKAERGKLVD